MRCDSIVIVLRLDVAAPRHGGCEHAEGSSGCEFAEESSQVYDKLALLNLSHLFSVLSVMTS